MEYKVPQDVQREDKIIGPFSLRQFLYLIAAAMSGYLVYSIFTRLTGSNGAGFVFGFLTLSFIAAFAVIEIQGKPLPEFVVALIIFSLRPRHRIWQKDIYIPDIAFVPTQKDKKEETAEPLNPTQVKSELDKLAHILDTRGWGELVDREVQEAAEEAATEAEQEYETEEIEEEPEENEKTIQEVEARKAEEAPFVKAEAKKEEALAKKVEKTEGGLFIAI